ncbi:MAG: hypothetical protein U0457_16620 [Candidatus Sericytochromatia bacterium]
MKKINFLVTSSIITLFGCQNFNNVLTNKIINERVPFKKNSIQDDDLGIKYTGNWLYHSPNTETGSDPKTNPSVPPKGTDDIVNSFPKAYVEATQSGFVAKTQIQESTNLGSISFSKTTDNNASEKELKVTNGFYEISTNSISIYSMISKIGDLGFDFDAQNTFKKSNGLDVTIQETNIVNNYNVLRSLKYNNELQGYLPNNWKIKDGYSYNFNKDKNNFITFEFTGTNVEIYTRVGPSPGWNDVKITLIEEETQGSNIFNENNPSKVKVFTNGGGLQPIINHNKPFKINGLKLANYKVKIESANYSKSGIFDEKYMFAFDKAIVYPALQVPINSNNYVFRASKYNSAGIINLILKDKDHNIIQTKLVDLYSPNPITTEEIFSDTKIFDKNDSYFLTIEATGEKNPASSGYEMKILDFAELPNIGTTFVGDELTLFFKKAPEFGKMYLYIDGVRQPNPIDLNSSTPLYESYRVLGIPVKDVTKPNDKSHSFSLVSAYDLNLQTGKFGGNLDAFNSIPHSAEFNFYASKNGFVKYYGVKNPDSGIVKLKLYQTNGNNYTLLSTKELDLFRPSTSSKSDISQPDLLNVTAGLNYSLIIEPSYSKNPNSSGYNIDVDKISVVENDTNNAPTIADNICEP